jgi:membrane associated rhomboid family serine protease
MNDYHHFKFTPSVWLVPTLLLVVIWFVFYLEYSFNIDLTYHGILPRTISGLQGIIFSPFLHGSLNHIVNNSIPLFILTTALIYFYRDISLKVLIYGVLLSGIITWVIGRESYHIGASSLIYVLVSFIFFKGMMTQYFRLMALSMAVVLFYGGMIWYVFPDIDKTISWEGHLAGLITGFFFAAYYKTPDYKKAIQYNWEQPDFNPDEDPFMKHFDENGNFVNSTKEEEILENLSPTINYIYEFKETPKKE